MAAVGTDPQRGCWMQPLNDTYIDTCILYTGRTAIHEDDLMTDDDDDNVIKCWRGCCMSPFTIVHLQPITPHISFWFLKNFLKHAQVKIDRSVGYSGGEEALYEQRRFANPCAIRPREKRSSFVLDNRPNPIDFDTRSRWARVVWLCPPLRAFNISSLAHSIFLRSCIQYFFNCAFNISSRIQYFFDRAFDISLRQSFVGGDQQTGVKSTLTGVRALPAPLKWP